MCPLIKLKAFLKLGLYQRCNDDVYEALGEMKIGKQNRSTQRKPALVPPCPLEIPHNLTWDQAQAAVSVNVTV
jgi:hypothetical protein